MARLIIGIPCYNEEAHISSTLISAIQQLEVSADVGIFISDNASTDDTVEKIERILEATPKFRERVFFQRHHEGIGAIANFWDTVDKTDSEFFMWLGGHDQLSRGYVSSGLRHMLDEPQTSMFCGQHVALAPNGNSAKQKVEYEFRQENPVERYLQSILQLDNCYVFHSMFRRADVANFGRPEVPSADHILISHLLWAGKLVQSNECFYRRRYFDSENRAQKVIQGDYVNGANNVAFFEAYLKDLTELAQRFPDEIRQAIVTQASSLLFQRFGLPSPI